ncbi:MAG: hypothetical protein ACYSOI_08015, partial [Planctomycetota bacterium]
MMNQEIKHVFFLSSLEHSAEMHCANLIGALNERAGESALRFSGFGGERLGEAGCELLDDTVSKAAM